MTARITSETLSAEVDRRIQKTPTCWLWRGTMSNSGYGQMYYAGRAWRAHRLTLLAYGVIVPDGMVVDHICRKRNCVNPAHLRIVDTRTNSIENSNGASARNIAKTICSSGHAYTAENTYRYPDGSRRCRICARASSRKIRRQRAEARAS